jgi:hypothetical protein
MIAIGAAVALLLSGCANIPESGQVRQGAPITKANEPLDLDFNPLPPARGATQDDILHGFIDAASSPKSGYAIARKFLTPSLAPRWNPDANVTVDQGTGRSYGQVATNTWQLSVVPVATVDASGGYQKAASAATPVTLRFQFVQVKGEWRISAAPDGVVIDASTFSAVFSTQTLYFYSPGFTYLVPDQRWFPSRVTTAATRAVKALLAGPSKWLAQGAVVSAFPAGTQLTVDAVTTSGGQQAQVDLSSEATQADVVRLERMKLQLQESLGPLAQSVQISIDGAPQTIGDLTGSGAPIANPAVLSQPLVYRGGTFGFLSGSTITSVPGISDRIASLQPPTGTVTAAALTADHSAATVLTPSGVYAVRSAAQAPVLVDNRPGLIAPAIDNNGYVWSVPTGSPNAVRVTGADGQQGSVKTSWTSATQIVSLAVSRDGTRLVAILRTGSDVSFVAAGIVRGENGAPTAVTEPLTLSVDPTSTPVSAAWTDELTVTVLGTAANGETTVGQQQLGGQFAATSGPTNGVSVAGASGVSSYLVLASDGTLQAPSGTAWQARAEKIGALGVQMGQPQ